MTELEIFRRQKDRCFKTGPDSPIPHDQRAEFVGLAYYPENAGLRLVVQPEEFAEKDAIQMITSTGSVQEYQRWGRFGFEVDQQPAALTIYYAAWGGFFVPFVDATSGSETYGVHCGSLWRKPKTPQRQGSVAWYTSWERSRS